MRKIAQKIGINYESIRLIAKNELWLKTYKLQKCQPLTDEHKKIMLERCRLIQRRAASAGWKKSSSCEAVEYAPIVQMTKISQQKHPDRHPSTIKKYNFK